MFSKLEFFIALRYLKSKNKEKFISITAIFSFVGIALGVAALIVVMSVMNGFREDFTDRILGINSHISIYPIERELENYEEAIRIIKEESNVKLVNSIIENQVMVMADEDTAGVVVKGIKKEDLIKKPKIYDGISSYDFDNGFKDNGIVLGQNLAIRLRVVEGDEIKLISPESNSTILGTLPRIKTYKVVGTFSSGMYDYDSGVAFIPLDMAQKHFKYNNSVGGLEVYLKDVSKLNDTYYDINKNLNDNGFHVRLIDWKESNSAFIEALNVERNVMFLILTLIILVATFNIISSLTMLVNDKNKQIALLRTIGFSQKSIMRIFFLCGSIIGVIGTLLGAIIGILFATNIQNIKAWLEKLFNVELFSPTVYFLTELPSKIILSDIIFIVVLSLFLSFLSTLYPSYKASKTNPAEILRYE
ncbi:MAG TPA: lipoprotein-releasing ABC transporter permease subunit [Rickettsiales bacterium]|nr:lipoprotein-releasing ABC transporter permease subunit [Rickettsiales bacterium]